MGAGTYIIPAGGVRDGAAVAGGVPGAAVVGDATEVDAAGEVAAGAGVVTVDIADVGEPVGALLLSPPQADATRRLDSAPAIKSHRVRMIPPILIIRKTPSPSRWFPSKGARFVRMPA